MQGIILAAGMGKRLKELTAGNTKCMVPVNGVTLIERCLKILDRKGLSRIVIVVGYEGKKLMDYVNTLDISTPIIYIDNPIYNKTNNIYSLSLASDYLVSEDTLLLESDLIFEESLIDMLIEDERDTLALVDKYQSWMDGTCMVLDEEDAIVDFIPGKHLNYSDKGKYYKTVNIYKFGKQFSESTYVPFLNAYSKAMGDNEYYESVIKLIAVLGKKDIRAKRLNGQIWYEIDDVQDLDIAESLFPISDEMRYELISKRYGGYWRYPKMVDFCYLVNPYYPTERLMDELESNFRTLLTQYPSGMTVNSLLAAKYFGVRRESIVVGNGAAELINALMNRIEGRIGFVRPTFEEYPNRYDKANSVIMNVAEPDFSYDVDSIVEYFSKNSVAAIVLINPDNPSGNYIEYQELFKLLSWCRSNSVKLIYDESFCDFAEDVKTSLIATRVLDDYKDTLIVVKSISKSHGVPGIRLGVIASGDEKLISELKKDVSIWNINSFGEYYFQIAEKYKKDYQIGIEKLICERRRFISELSKIDYIRVIPSQANFVMCELMKGVSAEKLACELLKADLFIKDLTAKVGNGKQYIRLAIRDSKDNDRLIEALQHIQS